MTESLIHLLQGDISHIRENFKITIKDDIRIHEMHEILMKDKETCAKIGIYTDKDAKLARVQTYLLAIENYVNLTYGKK